MGIAYAGPLQIVKCPQCGHRVKLRRQGTLVTHYLRRPARLSNQCPASRKRPEEVEEGASNPS